jgi:hypothetical protein
MNQLQIITLANAIIGAVAAVLGKDNDLFPTLTPKWRTVIVSALSIVAGGLQLVLSDKVPLSEAMITAATAGISGFVVVLAAAFSSAKSKAASAGTGVLVLAICLGAGATSAVGCKALLPILSDVIAVVEDANGILAILESAERAFFAEHPDTKLQADVEARIRQTRLALDTALRTSRGTADLSSDQADTAFTEFREAYGSLIALLNSLEIVVPSTDGKMMYTGRGVRVPAPLALGKVGAR